MLRQSITEDYNVWVGKDAHPRQQCVNTLQNGIAMLNKEKLDQSKILQLVDWQFNRYLSMQLLPLLYLLMIIGAVLLVGFLVAASFSSSLWFGLATACLSPLILLVAVAIVRAALEYLVMAHRTMNIVESMRALPDQVSKVEGRVQELSNRVEDIHETVIQLRPLLRSAGLPARLLDSLRKGDGKEGDK